MELHNLKPASGATGRSKRIARGQGSGHGGTSTRGHNGAKSRSGWSRKRNFEGGQMPLQMRLPKRGFNSPNRVEYKGINLVRLEEIATKYGVDTIDADMLYKSGITKKTDKVKILGGGELTKKLTVSANAASASAKAAIESSGGSLTIV